MSKRKQKAHIKALKETYRRYTFEYAKSWREDDWHAVSQYYVELYRQYKAKNK